MAAPTISSLSVTSGKPGEQVVVITGTNLESVYSVQFGGGVEVESFESNRAGTEITTVAPYGGADGVITVVNVDGEVSSASSFTYTLVATGSFAITTQADKGIIRITTKAADGFFYVRTQAKGGVIRVTTTSGDGVIRVKTVPKGGVIRVTTRDPDIVYTADLQITFEPSTGVITITDVTTWGSNGKPARPTQLLLTMVEIINTSVVVLTPDDVPENVANWTAQNIQDGVYRIILRDQANNILRAVLYPLNTLGSGVQNDMEVNIAENMLCNKFDYSEEEYNHLKAMNEALAEAASVDLAVHSVAIFKEAQFFAGKCNLKHKKLL